MIRKGKTFKKKHYTVHVNLNKDFREYTIQGVFMWQGNKERTAGNNKAKIVKNARLVVRTLWVDHDCGVEYQYCKCLVQQFCADHYMCTWSSLCSCEQGDLYAFTKPLAISSRGKASHFYFLTKSWDSILHQCYLSVEKFANILKWTSSLYSKNVKTKYWEFFSKSLITVHENCNNISAFNWI